MREFKVGDRVWDRRFGDGEVYDIRTDLAFPVLVRFTSRNATYTMSGKSNGFERKRDLFLIDELDEQEQAPAQALTAAATMSRRDEFAIRIGVALIERAGRSDGNADDPDVFLDPVYYEDYFTDTSIRMADALIAELDRTSQKEDAK